VQGLDAQGECEMGCFVYGIGCTLFGALLAAQPAELPDERPRIIVLEFSHSADVSVDVARTLTGLATAALDNHPEVRIVSGSELAELMALEGEKAAVGCEDDGCLAEIAGALGARFAVSGRIATLGELQVLQMRLMDVPRAEGLSRVVRNAKGLEVFVEQMASATDELMAPALARIAQERKAVADARGGSDSSGTSDAVESADADRPADEADRPSDEAAPPKAALATSPDLDRTDTDQDSSALRSDPHADNMGADADEGSSWLVTGSLIGGGLALVLGGVVAPLIITPIDLYLAFAVNPQLGLEDAIAPVVYGLSAVSIVVGISLACTPLFLGSDEEEQ